MNKKNWNKQGEYIGKNPFLQGVEKGLQKRLDKKQIVVDVLVLFAMLGLILAALAAIKWLLG